MDREGTLTRLRAAIDEEVAASTILEDHNQLVEDVSRSGVLEGMFRDDVRARLGRGVDCGISPLCARHGFSPSDWTYDVGRAAGNPELGAGPTLIIGFDTTGRVDHTSYVTRRGAIAAPR